MAEDDRIVELKPNPYWIKGEGTGKKTGGQFLNQLPY
jgi:hypothetical protein